MKELVAEIKQLNEIWSTEEDQFLEKLDDAMKLLNSSQGLPYSQCSLLNNIIAVLPNDLERILGGLDERWKALHVKLSKFNKSFEKKTKADLVDIVPEHEDEVLDDGIVRNAIDEAILQHFYREGNFDVADTLAEELDPEVAARGRKWRKPFERMHLLMQSLRQHDIQPALKWISEVEDRLHDGTSLKFRLHVLAYVEIVKEGNVIKAIGYAREKLRPFADLFVEDVNMLMGLLAYMPTLQTSPYRSLLSVDLWGETGDSLISAYCSVQGLPRQSALSLCAILGLRAWPKVSRVLSLMKQQPGVEWDQQDELPVEIPLPPEYRFHSVFVCPVLRQQATEDNPPMMLPCGHVVCQEALMRLCKGNMNYRFKCPYCPAECTANTALRLKLQ